MVALGYNYRSPMSNVLWASRGSAGARYTTAFDALLGIDPPRCGSTASPPGTFTPCGCSLAVGERLMARWWEVDFVTNIRVPSFPLGLAVEAMLVDTLAWMDRLSTTLSSGST